METFFSNLGLTLTSVINTLDPDVIVIGGGLSNIKAIYDKVPTLIAERVLSNHSSTLILQNQHGNSSSVRGAAWLWGLNEPIT